MISFPPLMRAGLLFLGVASAFPSLAVEPTRGVDLDPNCNCSPQNNDLETQMETLAGLTAGNSSECDFSGLGDDAELNSTRAGHCQKIMSELDSLGISEESFRHTLETFKNLHSGDFDLSCSKRHQPNTPNIKNECQFVINDLNQRIQHQSQAFLINICTGKVDKFKMNRAKKSNSTKASAYSDTPNAFKTSVGAYLTGGVDEIRQFTPLTKRLEGIYSNVLGWKPNDSRCRGEKILNGDCPAVRLATYGLHSSNNQTASGKPMHTSAFPSSGGCDSVEGDTEWVILELAKSGPSLVMNWGPEQFHAPETTKDCDNE